MVTQLQRKKRRSDLLGIACSCCKGHAFFPKHCELDGCTNLIHVGDDNWIRLDVMHHDRVGIGTIPLCSYEHALEWLAASMGPRLKAEDALKLPGCELRGHQQELWAMCDALIFDAQRSVDACNTKEHEALLDAGKLMQLYQQREAFVRVTTSQRERQLANYWQGVKAGVATLLHAAIGNMSNLLVTEQEMLDRVDWRSDPPMFVAPTKEVANGSAQDTPNGQAR